MESLLRLALGVVLRQPQGTQLTAILLVCNSSEDQVSLEARALSLEEQQSHDLHRGHVLHVDGRWSLLHLWRGFVVAGLTHVEAVCETTWAEPRRSFRRQFGDWRHLVNALSTSCIDPVCLTLLVES